MDGAEVPCSVRKMPVKQMTTGRRGVHRERNKPPNLGQVASCSLLDLIREAWSQSTLLRDTREPFSKSQAHT